MSTTKKNKHIIITGGAGFIGSNLVKHHLGKNDTVVVIDNLNTGTRENVEPFLKNDRFTFIESDLMDCDDLPELFKKTDCIYHLAAIVGNKYVVDHPFSTLTKNISLCQKVLETAAAHNRTARIIVASSSEVYGFPLSEVLSEGDFLCLSSPQEFRSEYSISKLVDESFSQIYFNKFNLPVTCIRLFNTVGRNQVAHYGMVVPRFVNQAITGEPITVIGDGTHRRSFGDVRDVVVMLDELADSKESIGKVVNVGGQNDLSILDLANLIREISQSDSKIIYVDSTEVYGHQFLDVQRRNPNLARLHQYIKYRPQWTIRDTVTDLVEHSRRRVKERSF